MLNKPTVLSTGESLFPLAVWQRNSIGRWNRRWEEKCPEEYLSGAFVYKSVDFGETFIRLGYAKSPIGTADCDEHMILELRDGRLMMLIRTNYGIGISYSWDGGRNWSEVLDSGIPSPVSRFFISRLKFGRILLINHVDFNGRNNLCALLSEDECRSWKYKLLIDERNDVSYPDAVERGGYLYIVYDRERGDDKVSLEEAYADAREILFSRITEEDIMRGKIMSEEGVTGAIVSKLGRFYDERCSFYVDIPTCTTKEAASMLERRCSKDSIISAVFELYPLRCMNMHKIDVGELDLLINDFESAPGIDIGKIERIIELIQKAEEKMLMFIR